ncbi:hypothetical protein F4782DRAFT_498442 [Xylaria castorea]|nr:hypothetical protein F4782DRAFT_498442 [Xylaria castorea]
MGKVVGAMSGEREARFYSLFFFCFSSLVLSDSYCYCWLTGRMLDTIPPLLVFFMTRLFAAVYLIRYHD